jgi:hypothetical protein
LFGLIGLAACTFAAGGCESGPYLPAYSYQPRPGIYKVGKHGAEQQVPPLTAMVTILGVRKADSDHHVGPAIDVRMRFESNGTEPIIFDPSSLDLVTGSLMPFPRPYVNPPTPLTLSSGQQQNVTATFPFPPNTTPGQIDLNELRLRWVVRVAGFAVPQTALFERVNSGYGGAEYTPSTPPPSDVAY